MNKEKYVIAFQSTQYAMKAEKELNQFEIKTIPTPREITASCGLSILFKEEDLEKIKQELAKWQDNQQMQEIYRINHEKNIVERLNI